jgi:hypothetical protein
MTLYLSAVTLAKGQGTLVEAFRSQKERRDDLFMLAEKCDLAPALDETEADLVHDLGAFGHTVTLSEQELTVTTGADHNLTDILLRCLSVLDEDDQHNEHAQLRLELRAELRKRGL